LIDKIENYEYKITEFEEYFNKYEIDIGLDLMSCGYIIKYNKETQKNFDSTITDYVNQIDSLKQIIIDERYKNEILIQKINNIESNELNLDLDELQDVTINYDIG